MSTWKLCDHPNHEYSIPHRGRVCNVKSLCNTKNATRGCDVFAKGFYSMEIAMETLAYRNRI